MSRRRRSVKAPQRKSQGGSALTWALSSAGVVLVGWILWKAGQNPSLTDVADNKLPGIRATNTLATVKSPKSVASARTQEVVRVADLPAPVPAPLDSLLPECEKIEGRPVETLLEAQIALARQGISSGSIDGVLGSQTKAALRSFQARENLPVTGQLDLLTRKQLILTYPALTNYTVAVADLERLHPVPPTWLGKSLAERLDYETILELISEKGHAHPELVRKLNPNLQWTNIVAGDTVKIPAIQPVQPRAKAALIRIELSKRILEVFDSQTNLVAHFPCSIAQRMEKRPIGQLSISSVAPNPNYTFIPEVFPESAEARELKRRLVLPSGPNNPVGVAWIGLDKPGYGIHGTPRPEDVGRTESHGCFRLANWDAELLIQLVSVGTRVLVEP